jgi:AraC-like DNA-binding protein
VIDEHAGRAAAPPLRSLVTDYVGYRQAGVAPRSHRGLPSPSLTFIITLDDPLVIAAHPDPRQPAGRYGTLLGGLHTTPAVVTHNGCWSGVQLGLTPLGARMLLGMPASPLANWDAEATDVIGGFATRLHDAISSQPDWAGRFAALDGLLRRRAAEADGDRGHEVRPEVRYGWRRLRETNGGVGVAELAAETGLSARRLGSLFQAEFGLAPKEAGRVFRFDRARRRIGRDAAAGGTLADLAAECGYYDQAHLAREFRALAGCPPSQWLAEESAQRLAGKSAEEVDEEFRFVQASPAGPREGSRV